MDLRIDGAEPSDAERAAVDAALGPPTSSWDGGPRDARTGAERTARGGLPAAARRDLLLPALHAVQDRVGWVSRGALNHICHRLSVPPAEAWGVVTFYHRFATAPRPPVVAHVCDDIACRAHGAEALCSALERALGPAWTPAAAPPPPAGRPPGGAAPAWASASGRRRCSSSAPARRPAPTSLAPVGGAEGAAAVVAALGEAPTPAAGEAGAAERLAALRRSVPQAGSPDLQLLRRIGAVDPDRASRPTAPPAAIRPWRGPSSWGPSGWSPR